jgi:GH24 family phage-related lysozyme (muramidase)
MGTLNLGGAALSVVGGNWTDAPPGTIIQVVHVQDGVFASGSGIIPIDNTTPQNTEGTEFMSLAITPTSATNKLLINVEAILTVSASSSWINMALFQDSTVDAIASWSEYPTGAGAPGNATFTHYMTAGTTSATTFKFRAGKNAAGITYFNGNSGGGYLNGTYSSSMTIMEIAA